MCMCSIVCLPVEMSVFSDILALGSIMFNTVFDSVSIQFIIDNCFLEIISKELVLPRQNKLLDNL